MILTCPQFIDRATGHMERSLGAWEALRCRVHLIHCRHCRTYIRQLGDVVAAAHELAKDDEEKDPELVDRLARALRERGRKP